MSKLKISQEFTLEVGDDTYTGIFNDLTKAQETKITALNKSQNKLSKQLKDLIKKIRKSERNINIQEKLSKWDKVEEEEARLETLESAAEKLSNDVDDDLIDTLFRKRLEMSLEGEDKEEILKVAAQYGYERVFRTIIEDITENRAKK